MIKVALGNEVKRPELFVSLGAVMISFSSVYVKLVHVGPTIAGFYRVLFGGCLLLIILLIRGDRLWKDTLGFFFSAVCGVLFALDLFCWHRCIHYVGPGLATILANFQVFILALFGMVILREKLSLRVIGSITLAMLGLFMIIGFRWGSLGHMYRVGLFLGLATALWYASFIIILSKLQSRENALAPMANLAVISLISAFTLACFSFLDGESFVIPDTMSLFALICYGLFSQVIGWVLITKALPKVRTSLAGLLLLLQPALSFLWDIVFFHREVSVLSVMGAAITLAAIYLGATGR